MLDDIKAGHPVETKDGYSIEILKIFEGSHGTLIAGVYRIGQGYYVSGLWDDVGSAVQDHPDMELREMGMDVKWEILPDKIQYVTMNNQGDFEIHVEEPTRLHEGWVSDGDEYRVYGGLKLLNEPYDPVYWKFSLTERP